MARKAFVEKGDKKEVHHEIKEIVTAVAIRNIKDDPLREIDIERIKEAEKVDKSALKTTPLQAEPPTLEELIKTGKSGAIMRQDEKKKK